MILGVEDAMRRILLCLATIFLLTGGFVSPVLAEWVPTDGHKMHFPQLPNESGWDVNATQPLVLADDWMCSESGPVKDIHFWGSWMHGMEGQIAYFVLSIHEDIPDPDGPGPLYSRPGMTLWEQEIPIGMVHALPILTPSAEGWYDPSTGLVLPMDHYQYFLYNVFLPENMWFHQDAGTIYWLNISAVLAGPSAMQWGWKSTLNRWNDDGVWAQWGLLNWMEMREPPDFLQSLNLAFVINARKEPLEACCLQDGSCIMATPVNCVAQGGAPQGAGTQCSAVEACCLPDGSCIMLDPLCCVQQGGMPLGTGTVCTVPEACCLPSGGCTNLDPLCCAASQGAPQGTGSTCTQVTACCLPDGSCLMVDPLCCDDMGGTPSPIGAQACLGDGNQNGIDDACEQIHEVDTCTYYKPPYPDYAPAGMPDFDQKQNGWMGVTQTWSYCGPVALANCFWWFDSKFEKVPILPPAYSDHFPLVQSYATMLPKWDDHDANNVIPFVDSLALYANCSPMTNGTFIHNLIIGAQNWLNSRGLNGHFKITPVKAPPPELIRDEVLRSQDVILLLGFYELLQTMDCNRLGGHYVTVAGVCEDEPSICISDPWIDRKEGEPPAGMAHPPMVHNDARFVSGPHGSYHHDVYNLVQGIICPNQPSPPMVEVIDYPDGYTNIANFFNLNPSDPGPPTMPYSGGPISTLIEWAIIICPDTCAFQYPGDVNNDGTLNTNDLTYLINYINKVGPPPPIQANADPDGNCCVDTMDVKYLASFLFAGGPAPVICTCVNPPLCDCVVGEANGDGTINVGDAVHIINYVFKGGPPATPYALCSGDANSDCTVNVGDAVHIINYVFKGGPAPNDCSTWLSLCGPLLVK